MDPHGPEAVWFGQWEEPWAGGQQTQVETPALPVEGTGDIPPAVLILPSYSFGPASSCPLGLMAPLASVALILLTVPQPL